MEKKHYHQVNQNDVDLIKALLETKLSRSKISKISKRSGYVITDIENCDGTLENYRQVSRDRWRSTKEAKKQVEQISDAAIENAANEMFGSQPTGLVNPISYANDVKVVSQQLEHIETQIQELIDNQHAMQTILQSKKLIW